MQSTGQSSAEIALLLQLSELARKYGLRPSEAEAGLHFVTGDNDTDLEDMHWRLDVTYLPADPDETREKLNAFDKMMGTLGCDENGHLVHERTKRNGRHRRTRAFAGTPRAISLVDDDRRAFSLPSHLLNVPHWHGVTGVTSVTAVAPI